MKRMRPFLLLSIGLLSLSAQANLACFEDPEGAGGNQQKKEQRDSMMEEMQDPAQDLLMCVLGSGIKTPRQILDETCGCKQAVDELCEFEWEDGEWLISAKDGAEKAWCAVFLPATL